MVIPYPQHARDWYEIWRMTRFITVKTATNRLLTTAIYGIKINSTDFFGRIESVKLVIDGGNLVVAFSEHFDNPCDEIVYTFTQNNCTHGKWYIPKKIIDESDSLNVPSQ